jgi:hypothetical protein
VHHFTLAADPDTELLALAGELAARCSSSEDTVPLGTVGCETRLVHPSVDLGAPSLQGVLNDFVRSLGAPYAMRWMPKEPSYPPITMDEAESLLLRWFVGGVVCEAGAFDAEPTAAADWITRWLSRLDDDGGLGHYRAVSLFDVRGDNRCVFVVTPRRVAMVCCIGWD